MTTAGMDFDTFWKSPWQQLVFLPRLEISTSQSSVCIDVLVSAHEEGGVQGVFGVGKMPLEGLQLMYD